MAIDSIIVSRSLESEAQHLTALAITYRHCHTVAEYESVAEKIRLIMAELLATHVVFEGKRKGEKFGVN